MENYELLIILIGIVLPCQSIGTRAEEENLIKLLAILANGYLKSKSDAVKTKFWNCIEKASSSPKLYAKCLVKLMRSKNRTTNNFLSIDDRIAYDIQLLKKWRHEQPLKQTTFRLLDSRDQKSLNQGVSKTVHTSNNGGVHDFIDTVISGHLGMINNIDRKEQVQRIINYVSNFFQFVFKKFQNTKLALSNDNLASSIFQSSSAKNRILSPRFLTLIDDDHSDRRHPTSFLSPDVFSLYANNDTNNFFSIPSLLKDLALEEKSSWLQFINETASALRIDLTVKTWNDTVKKMYNELGMDNATIINKIRRFYDTLDQWQLENLNQDGLTLIKDFQLNMLHGKNGQFKYKMPTKLSMKQALEEAVVNIAHGKLDSNGRRRSKRELAKPCFLEPSALASAKFMHYVVSYVILCPSALGPFVLGSLIVTPYILSPFVLAPFILSPFVLVPFMLSPFVLSPAILTPGVLSPVILDPNVLSPFILSPLVLTPTILTPSVLSPTILCPGVLSPAILSPSELSPVILSPCALCR